MCILRVKKINSPIWRVEFDIYSPSHIFYSPVASSQAFFAIAAHSANFTMATIEECGLQLLEHPPYSPDLAPSDFFLFPEMKRQLKGRRFEDRNEICAVTEEWLLAQPPHFYFEGLFKVKNRWQKCISLDGGWVEK